MTEKRRFLDVWIVESNTVYKEVPFEVVVDWVQQGRLLEDDMLKPSGTRDWFRLGGSPDFAPYLLKPEPGRVEDQAEALEPIGEDFPIKRPRTEAEDDDVDMIPLIDVSLVLLVFFMMIGTGAAIFGNVNTPEAENGQIADNGHALRIDISKSEDGGLQYGLAGGEKLPRKNRGAAAGGEEKDRTRDKEGKEATVDNLPAVLVWLKVRLDETEGPVEVVINADKKMPSSVPRAVLVGIRKSPALSSRITANYFGVSGKREE